LIVQLKNIVFVLLSVCFLFVARVSAQTDSVSENYYPFFQENIKQLAGNYFFSVESHYSGRYKTEPVNNFAEKYQTLQPAVFPESMENSARYFQLLNSLSETEQKNLVRLFAFYEKDFELALKKEQLPVELKYLAPALSGLNEKAIKETKSGVWQLTHFQAVLHGGEISRLIDDRLNIIRSTQLAARELKHNTETFKSTEQAVIAFICGTTKLKNILAEIGENAGVNEILAHLPVNISDVLAAFQAMHVFLTVNTFHPEIELSGTKTYN
jgi:membrane-bound lytic murein transglycosylase D